MKKLSVRLITISLMCLLILVGCGKTNTEVVDPGSPTTNPSSNIEEQDPTQVDNTEGTIAGENTDGTSDGENPDGTTGADNGSDQDANSGSNSQGFINDPVANMENDFYGDYREEGGTITYITGVSALEDGTYNATVFWGIETYAQGAGVSYSYCISNSNEEKDCRDAIDSAIKAGSHLIVTSGTHFNSVIGEYQTKYSDISFLMIDGVPQDADGNDVEISNNVHCIAFNEEEAGYLAGYITALDGYTKFGFVGGESVPPVIRYGSGFVQGIAAAAEELGNTKDVEINMWYSESFLPSDTTYDMSTDWYTSGTQVIFACGGSLYESVLASAEVNDGKMIGVDINQNPLSERVITSAMKGINKAVIVALDDYFAFGGWSEEMAGKVSSYGIADKCPSIPIEEWRFENVALDDYWNVYVKLRAGEIDIKPDLKEVSSIPVKINQY